jgi:hypothetical protein
MIDLFESGAGSMVLKSYMAAKRMDEKTRQALANDRLAIYHDDWKDILETILVSQFHPTNYKKIRLLKNTTQNILKKVIDDIAIVYKVAPVRDYGKSDLMDEIYDYLNIDEFMTRVDQYGTLLNDIIIRAGWDDELKRITLDLNTPANTSVIQRDGYPEQAAAIYYDIEYVDDQFKGEKLKVFWSDFEHFLFKESEDKDGLLRIDTRIPAEDNPGMINPYGKLPFIILHMRQIPSMFWNPNGGNDLVDGTTSTGFKRTLKDYLFKNQSFKQLWLRAQNTDGIADDMLSDPLSMFKLNGEAAQVGVLDITAAFAELDRTIQSDINAFLATYGLSIDMFATSGEEASGKALNIKNRGLREIREKQLPKFRRVEGELFNMIRLVYNTYNPGAIPESLEFKIDFAELETYIEPMQRRIQAKWDLDNNLISPAQFFMQFNPDIVDEKIAEAKIIENAAKIKDLQGKGFSLDKYFGGDKEKPTDQNA